MFNLVYLRDGMRVVDFDGKIRELTKEEDDEYERKENRHAGMMVGLTILVLFLVVGILELGAIWTYRTACHYFRKPPAQINCIESTTRDLQNKEIKIRAIVEDKTSPYEVKDLYVAQLLGTSDAEFDNFFAGTTVPLRQGITIFFIDQKYWDGEKICQWNQSGGCNIQTEGKNIILIPLSQDFNNDLRTLNHERTHAYFLNEPEITAHLVEYLFATNRDLSQYMFPLYRDEQGKLRF